MREARRGKEGGSGRQRGRKDWGDSSKGVDGEKAVETQTGRTAVKPRTLTRAVEKEIGEYSGVEARTRDGSKSVDGRDCSGGKNDGNGNRSKDGWDSSKLRTGGTVSNGSKFVNIRKAKITTTKCKLLQ